MTPPLLAVRSVSQEYTSGREIRPVLRSVSLEIRKGEHLGIIGRSGSGKSTLARLLLGVEQPRSGHIELEGHPLAWHGRNLPRKIQIVFQDPTVYLHPHYTVERLIREPMDIFPAGRNARQRRDRVRTLLESVGLDASLLNRRPHELSGGQCQRAAIARALSLEPSLLVCDEPFTNIDISGQTALARLFAELPARVGLTCLLISHDLGLVARLCPVTAVMADGRIVEYGETRRLISSPRSAYTRELLEAMPSAFSRIFGERRNLTAPPARNESTPADATGPGSRRA